MPGAGRTAQQLLHAAPRMRNGEDLWAADAGNGAAAAARADRHVWSPALPTIFTL